MSVHSVLIIAGMASVIALSIMMPNAANLLGIIPKKWQLWMLGETRKDETSKPNTIVM
jgi:hypothetical protein